MIFVLVSLKNVFYSSSFFSFFVPLGLHLLLIVGYPLRYLVGVGGDGPENIT
jgi:hypothetical protein